MGNYILAQPKFIENNELHVKVGGNHGGVIFMISVQIANVNNPNSTDNTIVFSIFEAKDYRSNIQIGLN